MDRIRSMPSPPVARWRERLAGGLLAALVLLLPLKLGSIAAPSEIPLLPADVWEWLFGIWPMFLAPALGGLALAAVAALLPVPRLGWREGVAVGMWPLFALTLLPGLLATTETDAAGLTAAHWLGVAALALATGWAVAVAPRLRGWLLAAVAAGTLAVAWSGWQQRAFGGLAETERRAVAAMAGQPELTLTEVPVARARLLAAAAAQGATGRRDFLNRLAQRRAFGPFAYPNSYAAHLLLTLPLLGVLAWRAGGRFAPARVSRPLFAAGALLVGGGALAMSESRAGILALGGGLAAAGWSLPLSGWRRHRGWVAAVLLALALAGVWAAGLGQARGLGTVATRLQYWRGATRMVVAHPLAGVGHGEFFPWYMRLKRPADEETRQPHAMVLGYAAQGGLPCGLAALGCCLVPPLLLRPRPGAGLWTVAAAQAGLLAWGLHAQADFNSEIPGTVMLVALLPLLVPPGAAEAGAAAPSRRPPAAGWLFRGGALVAGLAVAAGGLWRAPGELHFRRLAAALEGRPAAREVVLPAAAAAQRAMPWNPAPPLMLGAWAESQGLHGLARDAYAAAASRAPHRGGLWRRLARAAAAAGDAPLAAAAEERAALWSPAAAEDSGDAGARIPPPE